MNTEIYQEASDWLVRNRDGHLDATEKREFDAWLRRSPQHIQAYLELSAIWEGVAFVPPEFIDDADGLVARARAESTVRSLEPGARTVKQNTDRYPKRARSLTIAMAATVLLAILGGVFWYQSLQSTFATDIGEQRSIVLADGSTVELNSRSRVGVHFSSSRRELELLQGQALFRVAHDPERPFVVHIGTMRVHAVGTQFDVYRKPSDTVVTVVEGKVSVSTPSAASSAGSALPAATLADTAVVLDAGQQLTVPTARSGPDQPVLPIPTTTNAATVTAWIQRSIVFESSPLTQVAEEFNRYNARQLVVSDARLADFHISGVFSSVDPALLLRFLRAQPELRVEETDQEIRISRK